MSLAGRVWRREEDELGEGEKGASVRLIWLALSSSARAIELAYPRGIATSLSLPRIAHTD